MKRKHGLTPLQRIERYHVSRGECWEVTLSPNKVYPLIKINGRHEAVHRVAYESLVGPIPAGMYVLHHCDNPMCHRPEHLYVGTQQDNMRDMHSRGRWVKPKRRAPEKAILALHAKGYSQVEIAAQVNFSQPCVSSVLRAHGVSRGRPTSYGKHKAWITRKKNHVPSSSG